MRKHLLTRVFSLVLAAVIVLGMLPTASAATAKLRWEKSDVTVSWDKSDRLVPEDLQDQAAYKPTEQVRVSIVLEDVPTLQAGYATMGIGFNAEAMAYDRNLNQIQKVMERTISLHALEGQKLDVVWNLTLVGNIISANVPYGKIEEIKAVDGVKDVVIERQYEATETAALAPNMYSSAGMVGASTVWADGLTGAGSRIAIIDTGTDTDHQSFDNDAYLYALAQNAAASGQTTEAYLESLDLLDTDEIARVLTKLNAYECSGIKDAAQYRISDKLPFGANYIDKGGDVTHDHDNQGSHGSHVAGIAAANRYIRVDGSFVSAREEVGMSGIAPDAQLITMKVFGRGSGPSDSDIFAAIEDAIWLGCDSVNLSLGSGSPGFTRNYLFEELLDFMATTDTVVVISSGNSGHWAEYTSPANLYGDGVSFHTGGSPGSYTNALTVASVDNDGSVSTYIQVGTHKIRYTETNYSNSPISSLDTTSDGSGTVYDYIFVDAFGYYDDYDGMDLTGKVVFCQRGEINFSEKANMAAILGAAAIVVCNTDDESLGMDLSDYYYTTPCISITLSDSEKVRENSEKQETSDGVLYYTGQVTICGKLDAIENESEYYTMSDFSSWGVPGSLELKPEITAPGGLIWSVDGMDPSGAAYETMSGTSMAAPQVAGMAALVVEYIRNEGLTEDLEGYTARHLAQSLLMSTAVPLREEASGGQYYSVLNQGAGLARVDLATTAESFIQMHDIGDGKVKAELGDDPERTGVYSFGFDIVNLSGESLSYTMTADVFTQDLFSDEFGAYLSTTTRDLLAVADFRVNGVSIEGMGDFDCDLSGDGTTNAADAEYLLEYLLGDESRLYADGDVNKDGKVNSYDAHVLLTKQSGTFAVDVPANGAAAVEVTLELTDETKALLDEGYPNGAYIEGFVYATPLSDSEGEQNVTHSIPVLGYYGSWTEPSMFDVGSYLENTYSEDSRLPYLYHVNGLYSNFISVSRDNGTEYVFGGNPYAQDNEYLPERNAFNNQSGSVLNKLRFTPIRNAGNSMLMVSDAVTGEIYMEEELGECESAYFHVNLGQWVNPIQRLDLGLDLADFAEGTRLNISLVCAPEYYCHYKAGEDGERVGYTDWEALDAGAYLTFPVTIDNTAPVIKNVALGEDNTLRITAQDSEYIAAVALMNSTGTTVIKAAPVNQTQRGIEITADLSLDYVFGERFLVAVVDYAENTAVYEVTLQLDNERPYFTAIDRSNLNADYSANYIGMDTEGVVVNLAPASDRMLARAAEYVEGAVFEITHDNKLYVGYDSDLLGMSYLRDLDPDYEHGLVGFCDIAYNRADGNLYGLFYSTKNDKVVPYLTTIDLYTGELNVLGEMPIDANTIAIDGNGNFYSTIFADCQLHRYSSDVVTTGQTTFVGEMVGDLGYYGTSAVCSMAWDHNTDELYWGCTDANFNSTILMKVNTRNGKLTTVREYPFQFTGLYIAYEPEEDLFAPAKEVFAVELPESEFTLVGNTIELNAMITPWNASDKSVTWSSSDERVATVNANGRVTGISAGTAIITATSVLDSSKSASCAVTISVLDTEFKAVIWDEDGSAWWSAFNTNTIPSFEKLSGTSNLPVNAAVVAEGSLYATTLNDNFSELYIVDPDTFEMTRIGDSISIAYLDLAYGPGCGYGFATYYDDIVVIDLATGEYAGSWEWTEGLASDLVGIAYYGSEYNEEFDAMMDFFLILDAEGNVYLEAFLITDDAAGYFFGPYDGYLQTIGESVDTPYFQGFYYDGTYTYWSRFNEVDDQVELLAWDTDRSGRVYELGSFPEGVWPVCGLYCDTDFEGSRALISEEMSTDSFKSEPMQTDLEALEQKRAKGSLNAVSAISPNSSAAVDETQILVEVTMPEDATNGIFNVSYDAAKLLCLDAVSTADVDAHVIDNGTAAVAFADRATIPAGGTVASLRFKVLDSSAEAVQITITTTELNEGSYEHTETFTVELGHSCPSAHFEDVSEEHWFHEAVDYVVSSGYMNGMDTTHFGPGDTMNRAQFVTVLYRMEGEPQVTNTSIFTDVPAGQFYTNAAYWALETGITTGTGDGTTFNPGGQLTRTELVTFMYRYAKYKGYDTTSGTLSAYQDAGKVLPFAVDAWGWAVSKGIISGMTPDTLAPMSQSNRAQAAVIFQRFDSAFLTVG